MIGSVCVHILYFSLLVDMEQAVLFFIHSFWKSFCKYIFKDSDRRLS